MSTGDGVHWPTFAEVHASLSALLAATETRIVARIEADAVERRELERRLRAAEIAIARVRTAGAIAWAITTLLGGTVAGWVLTKF